MNEQPKHPQVAAMFTRLLGELHLSAGQFARRVGVTPQAVSNYVTGRNEPGRKMIAAIAEAFPTVNPTWLATGQGEPFPNGRYNQQPEAAPRAEPDAPAMRVHREGDESAAYWRALAEERQRTIDRMAADLDHWRDAFRKPQGSPDAAGQQYYLPAAPIGPRFDRAAVAVLKRA